MHTPALLSILLSGAALASPSRSANKRTETILNEFLADLLKYLPAIDEPLNLATGAITALDDVLAVLTGANTTENQLIDGSSCDEYTLIFARGTAEPGNMGVLVGPPLVWALQDIVGDSGLTIQGVNDYSASVEGYLEGGDPDGSANLYAFLLIPLLKVKEMLIVLE
jgi:cutinase